MKREELKIREKSISVSVCMKDGRMYEIMRQILRKPQNAHTADTSETRGFLEQVHCSL